MKKSLILSSLLIFLVGCGILSSEPYIKTYFFDIGTPIVKIDTAKYAIDKIIFSTSNMYRQRMVFRMAPNTVVFDEFNRWSMMPDALFERYFIMAIKDTAHRDIDAKQVHYSLVGKVMLLEADLDSKTISVGLQISLFETSEYKKLLWKRLFIQKKPVQKITGSIYAKTVRELVDNIINEVNILIAKDTK